MGRKTLRPSDILYTKYFEPSVFVHSIRNTVLVHIMAAGLLGIS